VWASSWAGAVGALTTVRLFWAIAVVCALAIAILIAVRLTFLLVLLVFAMFVESLSLGGGFAVGRLAGALALVVIAHILLARGHAAYARVRCSSSRARTAPGCFSACTGHRVTMRCSNSSCRTRSRSRTCSICCLGALAAGPTRHNGHVAFGALVFGLVALGEYLSTSGAVRASGCRGIPTTSPSTR